MLRTRIHKQPAHNHRNRPFFSKGSQKRETAPFFSVHRPEVVQRMGETTQLPEEEESQVQMQAAEHTLQREMMPDEEDQAVQPKALTGTTIQRMCDECEEDRQKQSTLQPKLTVGQPGDRYEQEADRVANQVVNQLQSPATVPLQTKLESNRPSITPLMMRQGEGSTAIAPQVSQELQRTRGKGQALAQPIRGSMEQALGADFSHVRIHTNNDSEQLNRSLNARAFTTGQDIYFKKGEYQPESQHGQKLLAHELTHVMQQDKGVWQPETILQRFEFCTPRNSCPNREKNESVRAKGPTIIKKVFNSIRGLLVGNFEIGSSAVKKDLASNAEWVSFLATMSAGLGNWEILGFTDCTGSESANKQIRQKRAQSLHSALSNDARKKVAASKAAPFSECMASDANVEGRARNRSALIYEVSIAAPKKAPTLATVTGPFDDKKCGTVKPGMDQTKANQIRACIAHARYVNIMNQSIANIKQVPTPYAKGLANFYGKVFQQVKSLGHKKFPTPSTPTTYSMTKEDVVVSKATTVTVPNFTLRLEQKGPQDINGSYSGNTLTLNETSSSAITKDQKDVERTMYHEGFHFLSSEVSTANQAARGKTPQAPLVHQELDSELVKNYKSSFTSAAIPFWEEALRTRSTVNSADIPTKANAFAELQWLFKVSDEALARVEEKIYLSLRAGSAFTSADLNGMPQNWLFTEGYWPSAGFIASGSMQAFLKAKRGEIKLKLLPIVLDMQKAFLRARPTS